MRKAFSELLLGGDLRQLRGHHEAVAAVHDQSSFDDLFSLIFHHERLLVMRAADAVEKVTARHPHYLDAHQSQLLAMLKSADHQALKGHIALLVPRLALSDAARADVWHILSYWVRNINESKIVRASALQGLYDLSIRHTSYLPEFKTILAALEHELIPSLQARIRKIKRLMEKAGGPGWAAA